MFRPDPAPQARKGLRQPTERRAYASTLTSCLGNAAFWKASVRRSPWHHRNTPKGAENAARTGREATVAKGSLERTHFDQERRPCSLLFSTLLVSHRSLAVKSRTKL